MHARHGIALRGFRAKLDSSVFRPDRALHHRDFRRERRVQRDIRAQFIRCHRVGLEGDDLLRLRCREQCDRADPRAEIEHGGFGRQLRFNRRERAGLPVAGRTRPQNGVCGPSTTAKLALRMRISGTDLSPAAVLQSRNRLAPLPLRDQGAASSGKMRAQACRLQPRQWRVVP